MLEGYRSEALFSSSCVGFGRHAAVDQQGRCGDLLDDIDPPSGPGRPIPPFQHDKRVYDLYMGVGSKTPPRLSIPFSERFLHQCLRKQALV
jgi:hypothetical protein